MSLKWQHLIMNFVIISVSENMLSGLDIKYLQNIDRRISLYSQNTNMSPR